MAANAQIREALDRMARGRQLSLANFATGDDFWALVDAAADETYENRVKGSTMTALDTALGNGAVWGASALSQWFTLHNDYFQTDLALSAGSDGLLNAYLAAYGGWRVPYEAAECYYDALQSRLPPARVFPKGTLVADGADPSAAGMHKFGRYTPSTLTATDGALSTRVVGAGIVAINLSAAQTVAGTFNCTCQDATTKSIALSLSTAAQYTQTILGRQAISSGAAAGQAVVSVAATAQFKAGEVVLIWESDALQEVATILSISTNTSLTMTTNLLNSYTTSGYAIPLFTNVAYASGGSGSGNVDFFALPDRSIAL